MDLHAAAGGNLPPVSEPSDLRPGEAVYPRCVDEGALTLRYGLRSFGLHETTHIWRKQGKSALDEENEILTQEVRRLPDAGRQQRKGKPLTAFNKKRKMMTPLAVTQLVAGKSELTGDLNLGAALHYGAHSVPHDAAVVTSVCPIQGGNQVPDVHTHTNTHNKVPFIIHHDKQHLSW